MGKTPFKGELEGSKQRGKNPGEKGGPGTFGYEGEKNLKNFGATWGKGGNWGEETRGKWARGG